MVVRKHIKALNIFPVSVDFCPEQTVLVKSGPSPSGILFIGGVTAVYIPVSKKHISLALTKNQVLENKTLAKLYWM